MKWLLKIANLLRIRKASSWLCARENLRRMREMRRQGMMLPSTLGASSVARCESYISKVIEEE